MSNTTECCFCKKEVPISPLISPFHEKYEQDPNLFGEMYAHICNDCLKDCHEGRKTEIEFKKAVRG